MNSFTLHNLYFLKSLYNFNEKSINIMYVFDVIGSIKIKKTVKIQKRSDCNFSPFG